MFLYIYYVCLVIFLLQGILWPVLVFAAGVVWWRQTKKLDRLNKQLTGFRKTFGRRELSEMLPGSLPKLKPLNCTRCGGATVLGDSGVSCEYCGLLEDLPEDYVSVIAARSEANVLLKSATSHWRVANFITLPFVSWFLFLMIFAEPLFVLPVTIIGSNTYDDTWADKLLESIGESATFAVMLASMLGLVVWMNVFIALAKLSKDLRRKLPVVPVLAESLEKSETASCQTCGGRIGFDAGAFASICTYCNVENFRVEFARRERAKAAGQAKESGSVLFGATTIIEDFVGTFFLMSLLLGVAAVILVAVQALSN